MNVPRIHVVVNMGAKNVSMQPETGGTPRKRAAATNSDAAEDDDACLVALSSSSSSSSSSPSPPSPLVVPSFRLSRRCM